MNAQVLYHHVRVREDGVERERLGESAYSCPIVRKVSYFVMTSPHRARALTDDNELFRGKRLVFGVEGHRDGPMYWVLWRKKDRRAWTNREAMAIKVWR